MGPKTFIIGAAALAAAQPALAADLADAARDGGHRSSAFAGVTLRVGLDRNLPDAGRPRVALGIGRIHERLDGTGRIERQQTPGLELSLGRQPRLLIGGERAAAARERLGISTGQTLLGIAALAAVVFVVSELADSEDDDDELICFLPEGCP